MTELYLGGAGLLVLGAVLVYNLLVKSRHRCLNAFAQIDVQLKRRYDLIPKVVEVVKTYMGYERDTLLAVVEARNTAAQRLDAAAADPGNAAAMKQLGGAEQALRGAMSRLLGVAEAYPDLKASKPLQQLTEEISTTENRIAFARQAYNDAVMLYNIRREMFPNSAVAALFRFEAAQMLQFGDDDRRDPRVELS